MLWLGAVRRRRRSIARLPRATVFMGVPTLYVRLLAEPALRPRGVPQHAPLHQRLGAAAARDLRRLPRAHRPHHPRALRHERDGDAHLQPVPTRATASGAAARSASRCPASACASSATTARRCRRARSARIAGARAERVRGLLAHAGEDAARSSPPTAGSRPATSAASTQRGYVTIVGRSKDLDHQRRLQRLPGRDRGLHQRDARRGRERGGRRAAPRLRRGGGGGRRRAGPARAIDGEATDRGAEERSIANFKVPKRVFVVDELPRNAMGKVQKNLLREEHQALFGHDAR